MVHVTALGRKNLITILLMFNHCYMSTL